MKTHDALIVTGTYQKDGETKKRYKNVGALMHGDHGPYLLLDRTFNPAGVPGQEGKESVLISFSAVKDRDEEIAF